VRACVRACVHVVRPFGSGRFIVFGHTSLIRRNKALITCWLRDMNMDICVEM